MSQDQAPDTIESIAIVGMAGRFPGARNLDELWARIAEKADCIRDLNEEELRAAGLDPSVLPPNYVRCSAPIDGIEMFDAAFFGYSPREAEILDPQSRVFLECAWEALESAGLSGEPEPGWIGVFAGVGLPTYYLSHLLTRPELAASLGSFQLLLANERDYFATRVSYKLDLRGPSLNVQTACSTSLVAVHLACQSLLAYQCTAAIAGGIRIHVPQTSGYISEEGSIFSPDGRCRSYDAKGSGALFGNGAGVVVLKRLSDAIADGDPIHAVIRGSAWNNDGSMKVGYTAPSIEGQAEVIALAQAVAGVDPATIGYVEGHGSGTPLGDPIEVAALTQAFNAGSETPLPPASCALGSIKSNVGHLEAAAGIAGLLKATLAMERGVIPPNVWFETPNPQIDFASSPFYVPTEPAPWPAKGAEPRRAGVSSFGMGGTNVHVILEEAPEPAPTGPSRPWQLLNLSARTASALETMTDRLAEWIAAHPEADIADVAHTLHTGKRTFRHRRTVLCADREDALSTLRARDPRRVLGSVQEKADRPVTFLLPGLGDHYAGMALGLYRGEPTFRAEIDRAAELLRAEGVDLLAALFPKGIGPEAEENAAGTAAGQGGTDLRALLGRSAPAGPAPLDRTEVAQPALFAVEYALATLLMEWGIRPKALAGYSLGEYTAACLAGVFSFEDGLRLVARRARLISGLPAGSMLSVALPEEEARKLATDGLSLAAVNGSALSVLAGPPEAVDALAARLAERGIATRKLPTTHAFHSSMMEPIRGELRDLVRRVRLAAPQIPYLSNVTGTWITNEQATDPEHWVRHLVEPVRFGAILTELLSESARVLVEVGPGQGLSSMAMQLGGGATVTVPTLRATWDRQPDLAVLLNGLARLWLAGLPVDWAGFSSNEIRRKLRLPTYPFEKKRFWIERATMPVPAMRPPVSGDMLPEAAADLGMPEMSTVPALNRHDRPENLRTVYAPPTDDVEKQLIEVWEGLLGVAPIGIHDSFFDLGGHSLLAPQLLTQLRQVFHIEFPMRDLFEAPTVAELAKAIDLLQREGVAALAAAREEVDLLAEAVLDESIRPEGPRNPDIAHPAEVFLTGATGFLGSHLLEELLSRTGARVHCLVRASDDEQAMRRVREALETHRLWHDGMEGRIVAMAGELGELRFGWSEENYRDLAARVDAVYHCAAWVNFTYPYKVLKPSNVNGTVEALRLAGAVRTKPLHFISSIAAVPEVDYGFREDPTVFEEDQIKSHSGLFGGYGETKWVSERLCEQARERGIPVNVYRPGVLSGDSRTGVGNTRDMVWNVLKGSIQLGVAPLGEGDMDVTPVNYVAASVVHISLQEEALNRAYHFPHPHIPQMELAFDALQEYGYSLERLPGEEWQRVVFERLRTDSDNALAPFLPVVAIYQNYGDAASLEGKTGFMKVVIFDDRNTQAAIAGSGIYCPDVDKKLLKTYFDWFVESGFLPPPQGRPVEVAAEGVGAGAS
jgi:phthiocerol/phenolphthiocerol synthesis type-I polyketide synthase E